MAKLDPFTQEGGRLTDGVSHWLASDNHVMPESGTDLDRRAKIHRLHAWTKRKIQVHLHDRVLYFEEREIWWSSLGENIGSEDNGKHDIFVRPVIILKKFSRALSLAIPVTTQ
ncbi:MAG TPA: hypothetical protein VJ694_04695, partial [Patescibacteria group bacterium]|nr:hypothetical protein [Patescibacteria group bacterium]